MRDKETGRIQTRKILWRGFGASGGGGGIEIDLSGRKCVK
jgi:hypothetical protein